jgi:hypothetical protein
VNAQGPYTVPYSTDFEEYASDSAFQIDWTYDNTQIASSIGVWTFDYTAYFGYNMSNCILYGTSSLESGDDWIFSPGFTLQAGTNYTLSFLAANGYSAGSEALKIYIGTDTIAATMTTLLEDFSAITGTTFTNKATTFSVPSNGTYYFGFFAYTSLQGYSMLIVDNFSIEVATGVEEDLSNHHAVYPNPSNGLITVENAEHAKIEVYTMLGTCVYKQDCNANTSQIDLSDISEGNYIINVLKDGQTNSSMITIRK